jgi:hypothetical protein
VGASPRPPVGIPCGYDVPSEDDELPTSKGSQLIMEWSIHKENAVKTRQAAED